MNELKIHDIKDIVEVPDISIYLFYGLIIFGAILVVIFIYFVYRYFKNKKPNIRKEYLAILNDIDLNDTKNSAYIITKYGLLIANSVREKELIGQLIEELESYKYKKDINQFDEKTKQSFKNFMECLDV